MINLLLSLLVILLGGVMAPAKAPPVASGPGPTVLIRPLHVRAGMRTSVVILDLPPGASHVRLVANGVAWPAMRSSAGSFTAHPVAADPGPWELDIRYRDDGHTREVLGAVATVR